MNKERNELNSPSGSTPEFELQYKEGKQWKTLFKHESEEYLWACRRGYKPTKWRVLKNK